MKDHPRRTPASPNQSVQSDWIPVASMPRLSSARFTALNRVYTHPIVPVAKGRYRLENGWRIVGWTDAPYVNDSGPHAIVYEKMTPPDPEGSMAWSDLDLGTYWGHGDATKLHFGGPLQ